MKKHVLLALFVASALIAPRLALAQGSLTPPGAPAPTMKTLDQIEARTPIAAATSTVTISQSGSYYLTGNIAVTFADGIIIAADNVTLDLNGFTISSTDVSLSGSGIVTSGPRTQITIFNGHIRSNVTYAASSYSGTGFNYGIFNNYSSSNIHVRDVSVYGVMGTGIEFGSDSSNTVENCIVNIAQSYGIRAGVVSNSSALLIGTGGPAIVAGSASNCLGTLTAGGIAVVSTNPTIKSLSDSLTTLQTSVTQRTPVSAATTLGASGSYYLVNNIAVTIGNGISITGKGITLDLNGYTISSSHATGNGVAILLSPTCENIMIRNGHIRSGTTVSGATFTPGGFSYGIFVSGAITGPVKIEDLTISGVANGAIELGQSGDNSVSRCSVNIAGGYGISATTVDNCTAKNTSNNAIFAQTVNSCTGIALGSGSHGIRGTSDVSNSTGTGIFRGISSDKVINCNGTATGAGSSGIFGTNSIANSTGTGVTFGIVGNNLISDSVGTGSTGISSGGSVTYSRGSGSGGTAITATVAIGCTAPTGAITATVKQFCSP